MAVLLALSGCIGGDFSTATEEGGSSVPDNSMEVSPNPTVADLDITDDPEPAVGDVLDLADADVADAGSSDADLPASQDTSECRTDRECDNDIWCDGQERCVLGSCENGTPPQGPSEVACGRRVCDEEQRAISIVPDDSLCPQPSVAPRCVESAVVTARAHCNPQLGCEVVQDVEPCEGRLETTCNQGRLTRVTGDCRVEAGVAQCVVVTEEAQDCRAPAQCVEEPVLTHSAPAQCDEVDLACVAKETTCPAPAPTCDAGVRRVFRPSCDAVEGCGGVWEATTCRVSQPTCIDNGARRMFFEPQCNGAECERGGRGVIEDCSAQADRCEDGQLTTFSGGCSNGRCNQETTTCRALGSCSIRGAGFLYTPRIPACLSDERCMLTGLTGVSEICPFGSGSCNGALWTGPTPSCTRERGCEISGREATINCEDRSGDRCVRDAETGVWEVQVSRCECSVREAPCSCDVTTRRCPAGCSNGSCDPAVD